MSTGLCVHLLIMMFADIIDILDTNLLLHVLKCNSSNGLLSYHLRLKLRSICLCL